MRTLALLLVIVAASILPASAEDNLTPGQTVIRSQEQAFSRDDAAAAYTFAASAIKSIFQTPDVFMSMVRSGYAPVYRHRSFEFGEAATYEGKLYQQVHIIDANGDAWEALYTLEPQEDGTFKISGCVLTKAVTS
jgi:Domain of unknown function (DUF4864)